MDGTGGSILWFLVFFLFIFIYPKLMLSQMIYKLEESAKRLEGFSIKARNMIYRECKKKDKTTLKKIDSYLDFFTLEPVSLDPYKIVSKLEKIMNQMEDRFRKFVSEIAGTQNEEDKQKINYGLRAGISVRQIAKIVRHNVEMIKKFKNLQLAMILQMQMPYIEKIAKSELDGTESFLKAYPIGDSIGPLVAASLMSSSKEIEKDVIGSKEKIAGRTCFILKASGPGPRLGRIDKAIKKIMKKNKIKKIITVDAAQKLEGEKSGSVASGVGFGMGGPGVQRQIIEEETLPKGVVLDCIAIKVGFEEAIQPMTYQIYKSLPYAKEAVINLVKELKKNEKAIIVGVGNSSGTCNIKNDLPNVEKIVKKIDAKRKKGQKKKKSWL
ncbi:MAG: DUF1512 family protein [Candidatus Aenigmarchaeota archaeon]|nr:DUF1512 family protein [Candidatus Aenigmarchaeota archaeon]